MRDVSLASTRASVAGWLLLTMLQLERNGYAFSLNSALPLVSDLLPKWQQPAGPYCRDAHIDHHPHSRRKLLKAYKQYRPVAHLWAAMIHGQQHERDDIWPGSLRTLPIFLAYAEAFLDLGCTLPSQARGRRFVLTRPEAWVFAVPDNAVPAVRLEALPLDDSQQRILDERRHRNDLM